MDVRIALVVEARGLGRLESAVPLKGRLRLPSGAKASPWLVLAGGAALVVGTDGAGATVLGPAPPAALRWVPLPKSGRVELAGESFEVAARWLLPALEVVGAAEPRSADASEGARAEAASRRRDCARAAWHLGRSSAHLAVVRALLEAGARRGDVLAAALGAMVSAELGEAPFATRAPGVDALAAIPDMSETLAAEWHRWELSPASAIALVRRLGASDMTLPLHSAAHARLSAYLEPTALATADVEIAEHLAGTGRREPARAVLRGVIERLGVTPVERLAPRSAVMRERLALRVRALELLARAVGEGQPTDAHALIELVRAEPLSVARLRAVAERVDVDRADHAREALDVLDGANLEKHAAEVIPTPPARRLGSDELGRLQGPSPRGFGAAVGALQRLIALPEAPDRPSLRDYCEGIPSSEATSAGRALGRATTILDLRSVECFVSRGRQGVGVRAFDGTPPLLLIGHRHLDPSDELFLSEPALNAAFASELAHVRFDHGRVTPAQVFGGAVSKSRQGLELFLTVLPALQGIKSVGNLGRLANKLEDRHVKRALDGAERVGHALRRAERAHRDHEPPASGLTAQSESLIEAHRYLQLTADRAGLVAARRLDAAVWAMIAVRPEYVQVLTARAGSSFLEALGARARDGDGSCADLALRLAGAIAFYLSDDYAALTAAAQSP